jgi:hypothetical protein
MAQWVSDSVAQRSKGSSGNGSGSSGDGDRGEGAGDEDGGGADVDGGGEVGSGEIGWAGASFALQITVSGLGAPFQ